MRVWDAQTGEPIAAPFKHEGDVAFAQFSPDGQRVVTASYDNGTSLGCQHRSTDMPTLKHESSVLSARFSPDAQRVDRVC